MSAALALELAQIASQLVAVTARLAAQNDSAELLTEKEAAAEAKVPVRTLRDARRSGALAMFGGQRSRTIRRADLAAWVESRKVKPSAGVDDLDMQRRMKRLSRGA